MKNRAIIILSIMIFIIGCKKELPKPPAPAVTVSKPITKEVVEWDEYSGRLESPQIANVSARVSGIITRADFQEGAMVKQGDLLFEIDDRPYKAELASRDADVAKAEAKLTQAQLLFNRYDKIRDTKAISAGDYDEIVAGLQQAKAELNVMKAAQEISKLNLEWTHVVAPISGKVSRKLITVGNLVNGGAGQATLLTTITSIDPLFCYVNIPERSFLKYQALAKDPSTKNGQIPCGIQLENEKDFLHHGVIDFIDNQIDPETGTVQIRGVIKNTDNSLVSGLFARLRVPGTIPYKAVLVPDLAIGTDQNSRYVLVVGDDGTVSQKKITRGALFGKLRAVEGLTENDKVVVNGLQIAKPGIKVTVTEEPIAPESVALLEKFKTANPITLSANIKDRNQL